MKKIFFSFSLFFLVIMFGCPSSNNSSYSVVIDKTLPKALTFGINAKTLSNDTNALFSGAEITVLNDTTPTYGKFKAVKMGAQYNSAIKGTAFRFFSPNASKVILAIYNSSQDDYRNPDGILTMTKSTSGVWYVGTKEASPLTSWKYYRYKIEDVGGEGLLDFQNKRLTGTKTIIQDPYARSNVQCDGHSIIIDPAKISLTNNGTWTFKAFTTPLPKDLIIYEVHIGDFTKNATTSSIPGVTTFQIANRGKYDGLKQAIPYFKNMGINCIELMPVHEYTTDNVKTPHEYSWGYLPVLFFAPESGFASDYRNGSSYYELRDFINECHKQGIAVILDVVITHTSNEYNVLYWSDPGKRYYFHLNGNNFAPLGTGNWIADGERFDKNWSPTSDPNRPFAKKIVLDNLRYWVEEFKVDGFRFDLIVGTSKTTLQTARTELTALNGNIFLTAENWYLSSRHKWFAGNGYSQWNDYFRDTGKLKFLGMQDNVDTLNRLKSAIYFSKGVNDNIGFIRANNPIDTTNYLESHDEQTVGNAVNGSWAKGGIGATLLLTSLGIPMIYEGQEFIRNLSKASQQAQNGSTQGMDWNLATSRAMFYKYFKYLVQLRRNNPGFRLSSAPVNGYRTNLVHTGGNLAVGYVIDENNVYGSSFVVLLNMHSTSVDFTLPPGTWKAQCAVLGNGDPINNTDLVFLGDGVILPAGGDFDTWGTSTTTWLLKGYSAVILKKL